MNFGFKCTYPSCPYEASTILGLEYAFEVTQVQCTANNISIMIRATIIILFTFIPTPSSGFSFCSLDFLDLPTYSAKYKSYTVKHINFAST